MTKAKFWEVKGNWGRVCPLKNAFFQFSKLPYLAKRREKAFVFWGGGNFLSKKCALQCLLSLAPIRGWSVLLIEVWKSLFWCKISGSFLFCKSQILLQEQFFCVQKMFPKFSQFGCTKIFSFFGKLLSKLKDALWTIVWAKIWLTDLLVLVQWWNQNRNFLRV